ncbi:MAG: DUF1028 domain-containing protein [Phycisphaerales bacterium]|nr:DUF1028 domain-containing protein [Phycisphaerales bacterium]
MTQRSMPVVCALSAITLGGCASIPAQQQDPLVPFRPVSTYSIVARDAETGQLGVAVQSHWFSVGSVVPWAESGVGAVATQSLANPAYGYDGLDLMRSGKTAPQALKALLAIDDNAAVRQVGMIDAQGNVASHTGDRCIAHANHLSGKADDESVYTCQANIMADEGVPEAMAKAFNASKGDLAERLLDALDAAQHAGGDLRGMQSAAILVVAGEPSGVPYKDKLVDLRVEDHERPLAEIRRLLKLHSAYEASDLADAAMSEGDFEGALRHQREAQRLSDNKPELAFWTAVSMVNVGQVDKALPIFEQAFKGDPNLRELARRLPDAKLLTDDPDILARILAQ